MIRMVDKDGDGQVSMTEFYEMVTGGKRMPPGLATPGAGPSPGNAGTAAPGMATPGMPPAARTPGASGAPSIQERNARKTALDEFARSNNIKPETIKKAYKRFRATDKDQSGQIDYTEFCEILQVEPSPQAERLFSMFDRDQSGQIDVREFMIGLANFTGASKEERLKFAFTIFDEDGNGVITKQELLKILKANHMATTEQEVLRKAETIMAQADKDGDGVINFDEFVIVSKKVSGCACAGAAAAGALLTIDARAHAVPQHSLPSVHAGLWIVQAVTVRVCARAVCMCVCVCVYASPPVSALCHPIACTFSMHAMQSPPRTPARNFKPAHAVRACFPGCGLHRAATRALPSRQLRGAPFCIPPMARLDTLVQLVNDLQAALDAGGGNGDAALRDGIKVALRREQQHFQDPFAVLRVQDGAATHA